MATEPEMIQALTEATYREVLTREIDHWKTAGCGPGPEVEREMAVKRATVDSRLMRQWLEQRPVDVLREQYARLLR